MRSQPDETHTRRVRRRRAIFLSLLAALVILTATAPIWAGSDRHNHATITVTVAPGDTLWELARTHGPGDDDPRRTVGRIGRINHLSSALIRPGDVLLIPTT